MVDDLLTRWNHRRLIAWYYTPMALPFSRHLTPSLCVYDNMDELSAFTGAHPRLLVLERELFRRADVVFTGGYSLYEAKKSRHPNVHAFPSSIDASHFARARKGGSADPADQAHIARKRVGFFGVVDERMDVGLLAATAALRPDLQFVMIGPVVKIDPATLPRLENIHWLGGKSYAELPSYLGGWDIGFMPFALNEATRFISPTKTPEFLAAGVPVVSTAIADVIRPYGERQLVEIATSAEDVALKINKLLAAPRKPWLERVDEHLASTSWDLTWLGMDRQMQRSMNVRRAPASKTTGAEGVVHV
jgi:glycosyltransferase involved in cell wall biosynthesis